MNPGLPKRYFPPKIKCLFFISLICLAHSLSLSAQIRITEYLYAGNNGEFVEFTNVGTSPVNMAGWSFDDATRVPGSHDLSSFGYVRPGQSVIITESAPDSFRTAWNLCAGIKVAGPYLTHSLGRTDEINVYDNTNALIDRLTFNDQTLGGPRASLKSAWVNAAGVGSNTPTQWTLSSIGDAEHSFKSLNGDIGNPGTSNVAAVSTDPCFVCTATIGDTSAIKCGSFTWYGTTYTASGNYSHLIPNGNSCGLDSTVTLHLTISMCGSPGPSTTQSPYLQSVVPGVQFTSLLSANDSVGGYKMSGVPDGLGAFDNGDTTFTLLMNHELLSTQGVVRAHGSKGAFISKWIFNKSTLKALSGSDLIQNVKLWNGSGYDTYNAANPSALATFNRFCSADLPAVSAYYNSASGLGTQERIFMNGEEFADGRAMAHIVTGANAGTSYQLPWLGKLSWENAVANPYPQNKTIVAGTDDASVTTSNVYFYVGTKANTGTEIDRAGLNNGKLYGVKITGYPQERVSSSTINNPPAPNTHFDLADLGNVTSLTGAQLDAASGAAGATYFSRTEDGAWDPSHLSDYYFVTTDQLDQVRDGVGTQVGRSRLWRLRFTDITQPELGGVVEALLDGTEGQTMLDNIAINKNGYITLLEDVGNAPHNGKVWQYNIATDVLTLIGKHDPARFGDINVAATAPFNQDEESSGVIDMQEILGPGKFLLDDQAHYATGIPADVVEGGQLLLMFDPFTVNTPPTVSITSPANNATFDAGRDITAQVQAIDPNGSISKVKLYVNDSIFATDSTAPYSFTGMKVESGMYTLKALAFDNNGDSTFSDTVTISVTACTGSGSIVAEGFTDIPGALVSDLTSSPKYINNTPDVTVTLNRFEYGQNLADNYGGRVRGYICAPATGLYTFYIASDDQAGLWLSADDDPAHKALIAYNESYVGFRAYTIYASQKSAPVYLVKGGRYYIETLHKESTSTDHLSVAWKLPNGVLEAPIAGSRLTPYSTPTITTAANFAEAMQHASNPNAGLKVVVIPNPSIDQFTLQISSGSNEAVVIKILDISGRALETKQNVPANGSVKIGSSLSVGTYIAEVIQGKSRQALKLIKQ